MKHNANRRADEIRRFFFFLEFSSHFGLKSSGRTGKKENKKKLSLAWAGEGTPHDRKPKSAWARREISR